MTVELTQELAAALHASGERGLELVDPQIRRTNVLVHVETHHRAMQAMYRQPSYAAIADGVAQVQAGEDKALDEAFSNFQEKLGFPMSGKVAPAHKSGVTAGNERVSNCQVSRARPSVNR